MKCTQQTVKDVRSVLPPMARKSSLVAGVILTFNSLLIFEATFAAIGVVHGWILKCLFATFNGAAMGVVFIVGHDACHQSLTPNAKINRLLGRLCFVPSWHPFASWEYTHNGLHHAYTCLRGVDPGYPPFTKSEFDALPSVRQRLERLYRTPIGVGLFYFVTVWLSLEMFPSREHIEKMRGIDFQFDRLSNLIFVAIQSVFLTSIAHRFNPYAVHTLSGAVTLLLIGIVIPFSTWMWLMGFLTFQHHSHPLSPWYDSKNEWSYFHGNLCGSIHVVFPKFIELILHNIMDHTAHHVDPKIPLYRLRESQSSLEQAYENDIIVEVWNLMSFCNTMKCCKLYDFERHCWLDFEGNVTSKASLPALMTDNVG